MLNMTSVFTRDGFTLLEVIIVLAILSLFVGMLVPLSYQLFVGEQSRATETELQELWSAIVGSPARAGFGYVGDVGRFPATLVDLVVAPRDGTGGVLAGWKGPYVHNARLENGLLLDPYGRPYEYFVAPLPSGSGNQLAVASRGPDGVSTNTAANPNVARDYTGPVPTDAAYANGPGNADNIVFPTPSSPNALDKVVSGELALNILNFDANPAVNAFVPACPQLFRVTATSVTRDTNDVAGLPYTQGLTVDLVQGQYRLRLVPGTTNVLSWTEAITILPGSTATRTVNLTGLDSSGTPQFVLTVKNGFTGQSVTVHQFGDRLKGAPVGSTAYTQEAVGPGQTLTYLVRGCAQVSVKPRSESQVLAQFVMPYGPFAYVAGANAAGLTVVNRIESRLLVLRNSVLVGTVPRGDRLDDGGEQRHTKTKTFADLAAGDLIEIRKSDDLALVTSLVLVAGANTVTLQ